MPGPSSLVKFTSLAFLIHEICITFDDEVNFIWSQPNNAWIKWLFLFIRYFALISQIANRTIDEVIISQRGTVEPALKNWYLCQAAAGSITMLAVELVLMARVYALYKKNLWVGSGFAVLIFAKITAVAVGITMNIRPANFTALFTRPNSYMLLGICGIFSQITILTLTLIKYWTAIREGWGAVPIMALVVRDGIVTFFIFIVLTIVTVVATSLEHGYASIGNAWLLSIAACAGCRLIINMQQITRERTRTTVEFELTTL